jgi:hypothetical protein
MEAPEISHNFNFIAFQSESDKVENRVYLAQPTAGHTKHDRCEQRPVTKTRIQKTEPTKPNKLSQRLKQTMSGV